MAIERARSRWPELPLAEQVAAAVRYLGERGALIDSESGAERDAVPVATPRARRSGRGGRRRARPRALRPASSSAPRPVSEAASSRSPSSRPTRRVLSTWGADEIVHLDGSHVEEDIADVGRVVGVVAPNRGPCSPCRPRADARSAPARAAARCRPDSPATRSTSTSKTAASSRGSPRSVDNSSPRSTRRSPIQMATVRAGMLPTLAPRRDAPTSRSGTSRSRRAAESACSPAPAKTTSTCSPRRDAVIGVGTGCRPDEYAQLEALRTLPRRRARRDAQGHRQGLAPARAPDRHHRPVDRAAPVRQHRRERQVQPQRRRARRAHRARDQPRSRRADLARRRHRHRGRLARSRPAPGRATAVGQRRYAPMRRRMSARSSLFATLPPAEAGSASTTTRCSGNVSLL